MKLKCAFFIAVLLFSVELKAETVPGVVIDHYPASEGIYVGSPSIAILDDGSYVASHDEFGPKSTYATHAVTKIFRSQDRGVTWKFAASLSDALWGNLFVHKGKLYLLGVNREYGDLLIRASVDGGRTWTKPVDGNSGVIASGKFHTAPVPVVEHAGRLWRGVEDATGPGGWGARFCARVMSAPIDADLLRADSWTLTNPVARDPKWLDGRFGGWLEGNAVVDPEGKVVDLLRVDYVPIEATAALIRISADGTHADFDAATGFVHFDGGGKKFTIRQHPKTRTYWTLANVILPIDESPKSGDVRNTVALLRSDDLKKWDRKTIVLTHSDPRHFGFQYLDWQFDGDDLVAVSRTAFEDGQGGAARSHDANFFTFHRIRSFARR